MLVFWKRSAGKRAFVASQDRSGNRDELVGEVKDLDYGNGTRLWDAVGVSLDQVAVHDPLVGSESLVAGKESHGGARRRGLRCAAWGSLG